MPQNLTKAQLEQYKNQINSASAANKVDVVAKVYADLAKMGYSYAGWAGGVAEGNTLAGLAALNFLEQSAAYGGSGVQLTNAQIDKIRVDMALRTLNEYIKIAKKEGGLSRDLTYKETRNIHEDVFKENCLSLDNWTLEAPMQILREAYGDDRVEAIWISLRETGGKDPGSWLFNVALAVFMLGVLDSDNKSAREKAWEWFKYTIPYAPVITNMLMMNSIQLDGLMNELGLSKDEK